MTSQTEGLDTPGGQAVQKPPRGLSPGALEALLRDNSFPTVLNTLSFPSHVCIYCLRRAL